MKIYQYNGPVMLFNRCIADKWSGETRAVNKEKAKSNLAFRYKTDHHLTRTAKITLPGTVVEKEEPWK